ncbi:MAG: S41 family peptidase [Bacteroidetes bacterium]|nr:S41 family peptidase [Bacteroidota bacterium]
MSPRFKIILPLIFALLLATGIFIGSKLNFSSPVIRFMQPEKKPSDKLNSVLNFIEEEYVDTVKKDVLVEKAISDLLQNLDPHSVYMTAKDVQEMREPMEGNFEGIGIEFNIIEDTIRVISAIAGGPSEELGIQAGDKIVKIEGKEAAGVKIKNKDVLGKLRGKGGTKVKVSIMRGHSQKLIDYTITRGMIPIYSVDAGYMLNKNTGYIKVSRFAETTHEEFLEKASKLRAEGMKNLILDLRGNGGGLLSTAIKICDEFLEKGQIIVYTKGKSHAKETIKATDKGILTDTRLIVLIDENSASASEIVSGAIQDNDRGTIVGRRSFGKGLVQRETMFSDSSAIRLTVARYYTPTGRCIQKPYGKDIEDYYNEEYNRYKQGELMHADSIHENDSLKYTTQKGKIVYGGGGITPDVFIPLDTAGRTPYLSDIFVKGALNQFSFDYADKNRKSLSAMNMKKFQSTFMIDEKIFNEFRAYAEKLGVKTNLREAEVSKKVIKIFLKASIARQIWGNEGFYPILNEDDKVILKSLKLL